MAKIPITNDLFDIADRLKSINEKYIVYYDTEKQRYEVYVQGNPDRLAFVVPYDELDARTIDYALFTSVRNAREVFEAVERDNKKAEETAVRDLYEKTAEAADRIFSAVV